MTNLLKPFVVVWFWFFRWVVHNKLVYHLRPLGKNPNILSYPFIFVYYVCRLVGSSWNIAFANYGLKHYVIFLKQHYSATGWGKTLPKTDKDFSDKYKKLHSRFAYYLDNCKTLLDCKDGDSFLDVACGSGENLKELSKRFPNSKIYAFDISPNAIDFVNRSGYSSNITCEIGNVLDFDYLSSFKSRSFDWVLYSHAFSFVFDSDLDKTIQLRKRVLAELARISSKGFIMLESAPHQKTKFVLEQNTRATLELNTFHCYEGLSGELYSSPNRKYSLSGGCAYILKADPTAKTPSSSHGENFSAEGQRPLRNSSH